MDSMVQSKLKHMSSLRNTDVSESRVQEEVS